MATIKYNGMEIESISECKVFDDQHNMLVWNRDFETPIEKFVCAIIPYRHEGRVITRGGAYDYCAEVPEKPAPHIATNRELAKWLAHGYGEWKYEHEPDSKLESNIASINYHYEDSSACNFVSTKTKVRKWSDTEWHTPDVEYMGITEEKTYEDVVKREG